MTDLSAYIREPLRHDGDLTLSRATPGTGGRAVLLLEGVATAAIAKLEHEWALAAELDADWAVRARALIEEDGRAILVLDDPGGEPLDRLITGPMEAERFLPFATALAHAVAELHARGLIHKDVKPANVLADTATGQVRLMGFGIASRRPRERQQAAPPEIIAGTLPYMAPEQTGRMNRSIDARSDLYALGVTFYEMLTGTLPFSASEPMEWVHCHVARTPIEPVARVTTVPRALSAIVMRLLAKTPEDRYQTAAGVAHDLRRCRDAWERHGRIDDFPLGERDTPDRLRIPEKLYGRTREVDALLTAFDRVVRTGMTELVLVSGYSGIGKSSVVNELHTALVRSRGLFAAGKFDQYKRSIPYSTVAHAFRGLVAPLLGQAEHELAGWRDALRDALGPNGRLMTDLVPELALIIGEPQPVTELSPHDAQRRFHTVVRRFIGVFARPEHPLALFLDDLQWLDAATLDLLEDLLMEPDVAYVLLVGAYRDNEVDATHPLARRLDAIRHAHSRIQEIRLGPLDRRDVSRLVADTLRCEPARVAPLATLVHTKTAGNPFFVIQFLYALADEGLLTFAHHDARWSWDLGRIEATGYTDNIVDLMVGKLGRVPVEVQRALQTLACLGSRAEVTTLSLVQGVSEEQVHADLWEALRLELIDRSEHSYQFVHDRVHEAAYALIPEDRRPAEHLRIGRLLATRTPPEKRAEAIFEIVNQLDRGVALVTAAQEREQIAELNLIAGRRAKEATAYESALSYFTTGSALLGQDGWERCAALTFALELQRAECEFLTGAFTAAESRLAALAARASTTVDRAAVTHVQIDLYTTMGRGSRAIACGLGFLRHLGIDWSAHPSADEVHDEYARIQARLGGRAIEDLVDLPPMSDPASLATLDVLTKMGPPALFTDPNLDPLLACKGVALSLEHGNCGASSFAYTRLGMVAGPYFGDYQAGYRFGRLGYELAERHAWTRFQAAIYVMFAGAILPWTKHLKTGRDLLGRAFDDANRVNHLTQAVYSCNNLVTNLLAAGDPLDEVQRQAENGLAFARRAQFGLIVDVLATQLALIRMLRGSTPTFGVLDDADFDESRIERRFAANPELAIGECWYWIRKLQARFLAGDATAALAAAARAQLLLWTSAIFLENADYHLYSALAHAASYDGATTDARRQHREAIADRHHQLQLWATNCPENFAARGALVGAEMARVERRELDAERLYEEAIRAAHAHGFVNDEALANELAARFYRARGFEKIARTYLRDARACYERWGALGKVRQLDDTHPELAQEARASGPVTTIAAPVQGLDVATVISVAQAIARETAVEPLIDAVMRTTLAHAGAERGVLLLADGGTPRAVAEAVIAGDDVAVTMRDDALAGAVVPQSIVQYVARTRETVIVDDATTPHPFAMDEYVRARRARSICCAPLVNQGKLIAVLYLENGLAAHVFTPTRVAVLDVIASQAAISLEKARLDGELARRDAQVQRLADANLMGVINWRSDGAVTEANDAFLTMVGYDRVDLAAGRVRWTDLTPPEWRAADRRAFDELNDTGAAHAYEKEFVRRDGSRVPVLIGTAWRDEVGGDGVAFTLDLTRLKEAEAALRETRAALTHVARVATVGEVTGSIAHELSQPLAAIVADGNACLRWLAAATPDVDEARACTQRTIAAAHRLAAILDGVRRLARRSTPEHVPIRLAEIVDDVVTLAAAHSGTRRIAIETDVPADLPTVMGDRVQLQQVLLNLVVNAMDAMTDVEAPQRRIEIRGARDGNANDPAVRISVVDRGIGLRDSDAERLFQAFHTTKPHGMGLGLAISRSIIESHGGRLWAEANRDGGATFAFRVPAAPAS